MLLIDEAVEQLSTGATPLHEPVDILGTAVAVLAWESSVPVATAVGAAL